jgi:hypothetical protein
VLNKLNFSTVTLDGHIYRHWMTKHKEEHDVVEIMLTNDKNLKIARITGLRNLANHMHNMKVLRERRGELIVKYRSNKAGVTADDYLPCEYCFDYLLKSDVHWHKCQLQAAKRRGRVAMNSTMMVPPPEGVSNSVHDVINGMQDGGTELIAKTDGLVKDYAVLMLTEVPYQFNTMMMALNSY